MDHSWHAPGVAAALRGDLDGARREIEIALAERDSGDDDNNISRSLLLNHLGVIDAVRGHEEQSHRWFQQAVEVSLSAGIVARNRAVLNGERVDQFDGAIEEKLEGSLPAVERVFLCADIPDSLGMSQNSCGSHKTRVAILSLLFNWPSTGGGTVHTKELATFLCRAGYDVRHFSAQQDDWQLGQVREKLPYPFVSLPFRLEEWTPDIIRTRFREALDDYAPDVVLITDIWNTKVLLAEAAQGYNYYLRIAALECLCPLNNVRLRPGPEGHPEQCPLQQLAEGDQCQRCVQRHGSTFSGGLHQAERELAGFSEPDYPQRLAKAFRAAAGVLAVNPEIAELCRPYTPSVTVLPSGFDASRFPAPAIPDAAPPGRPLRVLFAGLPQEYMKGFSVLQQAAVRLWDERQDFEVWVTGDSGGSVPPWLKHIGWQTQEQLPDVIRSCDLLVFPTLAQEALGRTAVEAMGCGRPVVASRLGGLAWVVEHEMTGLLCAPGDPVALAEALARLLDSPALRAQYGRAGREKFERDFTWEQILIRYEPLLGPPVRNGHSTTAVEIACSRIHSAN